MKRQTPERCSFRARKTRVFAFSLLLRIVFMRGTQDARTRQKNYYYYYYHYHHHHHNYSDDEDEEGVSQKLHSRCPNLSVFPAGFVRTAGLRAIAGIFMLPWMS